MKVSELIAILQTMPPDKDVFAEGDSCIYEITVEEYKNPALPEDKTYVLIYPA